MAGDWSVFDSLSLLRESHSCFGVRAGFNSCWRVKVSIVSVVRAEPSATNPEYLRGRKVGSLVITLLESLDCKLVFTYILHDILGLCD